MKTLLASTTLAGLTTLVQLTGLLDTVPFTPGQSFSAFMALGLILVFARDYRPRRSPAGLAERPSTVATRTGSRTSPAFLSGDEINATIVPV